MFHASWSLFFPGFLSGSTEKRRAIESVSVNIDWFHSCHTFSTVYLLTKGITTVLTLSTLAIDTRTDLPKVHYATALDWFIFITFGYCMASLIQFASVHYFTKVLSLHIVIVEKLRLKFDTWDPTQKIDPLWSTSQLDMPASKVYFLLKLMAVLNWLIALPTTRLAWRWPGRSPYSMKKDFVTDQSRSKWQGSCEILWLSRQSLGLRMTLYSI